MTVPHPTEEWCPRAPRLRFSRTVELPWAWEFVGFTKPAFNPALPALGVESLQRFDPGLGAEAV